MRTLAAESAPSNARSGAIALFFAATGGGVQSVQVTLAGELAARGFPVSCVLPQAKGPYLKHLPKSVELVDLGTRSPLALVRRLAGFLRRRRPSLLLAAQHHTIVAAVLARRLAGSRVPL
ncbi:MAG TPA: glycosyltransferase, partial [Geminicoccaceae bacterium]|nr:glycosyltransferase [Geminicoccaceae bacterium]